MANTLTGLIPTIYTALDTVSREMVGLIGAVSRNAEAERAAVGQQVTAPVVPQGQLEDIVPAANPPTSGSQTIGTIGMTISKSKAYPILWNGEEQLATGPNGVYNKILHDQFEQGLRTFVNAIEGDVALEGKLGASRAYGTAGTAPFGTAGDFSDFAGPLRILEENGAPKTDLQMGLGSGGWFNLRSKQSSLFKVNEAGSAAMLRDGLWDRIEGFAMRNSGQVATHTKGTGSGYLVNNASGYAVGATQIAVDTGTGTIVAGDVITFAGDTNKYVVATALTGGVVTIAAPGLRQAVADNAAITVGNSYTANLAFARNALVLATRLPALPKEGDSAADRTTIQDPVSGLIFEVSLYKQYRQVRYEIGLAWGQKAVKSEHISLLIG